MAWKLNCTTGGFLIIWEFDSPRGSCTMVDFDDLPTSGVLHYDGYSQTSLSSYAGGHNRGAIFQAPSIGTSLRKDVYAAFHKMMSFSKHDDVQLSCLSEYFLNRSGISQSRLKLRVTPNDQGGDDDDEIDQNRSGFVATPGMVNLPTRMGQHESFRSGALAKGHRTILSKISRGMSKATSGGISESGGGLSDLSLKRFARYVACTYERELIDRVDRKSTCDVFHNIMQGVSERADLQFAIKEMSFSSDMVGEAEGYAGLSMQVSGTYDDLLYLYSDSM